MATEDAKLKFLPRHLQITQPASSQKSKRRVTVEDENAGDEESDRRSVFDRLGPGGSQRNEKQKPCFEFQEHGKCPFGKSCIYSHTVKERNKSSRDGNKSPDNLRLTFKGDKDKDNKVRSQVVVRKTGGDSVDDTGDESDSWSIDNLKQKRQEIQRALIALEAGEEPAAEHKKSGSSELDSSPERPPKKKKDKTRKKEKKKHKKDVPEKEQPVDKSKDNKRRHETDDDDAVPRKKHKKKNKEKKHVDDPPPPITPDPVGKQKKGLQVKSSKAVVDLYDPNSPTSVTHGGTPEDNQSSSSLSPKTKGKGKKKKKKQVKGEVAVKSKKLVSPLKKVIRKKGSGSVDSSKQSRSVSRDAPQRKRSRSRSPSSTGSSSRSPSPVRRRKAVRESSWDRGRKKSKSLEKKKRVRNTRRSLSSSSSSSSSSSMSSGADRGRRRIKKISHIHGRSVSQTKKSRPPMTLPVRKDIRVGKRKTGTRAEAWTRSKDRENEMKKGAGHSLDRGREKLRDKNDERDLPRRNLSQAGRVVKETRQDFREKRREVKDGKPYTKDVGRPVEARRENRERDSSKTDRGERRDENREKGVRDVSLNKDRDKERDRRGGSLDRERERDRRGGSLDREREDRNRRSGGFAAPQGQQVDRGGRFPRGGIDDDRDRRNFDEGGNRYPPNEGQRLGQFQGGRGRQRGGFDRGPGRGGENQGRPGRDGREWDDRGRREGGDGFREDWEGGRDGRGGFGGYHDEGAREFGAPRDDRRGGGREERLLPHLGGWDESNKPPLLGPDSRDRNQRGQGFRDNYTNEENTERRDWKQREGSQESATQKNARDTDAGQGGRAPAGGDGRLKSATKVASEVSTKDKLPNRDSRAKNAEKPDTAVMKVKTESGKEESPLARDEPSLATLFSQTETAPTRKKQPAKSFGGKKSPKKTEDIKTVEKAKPGLVRGMAARGRRIMERKNLMSSAGDAVGEKEAERDGAKVAGKKGDVNEKSRSLSPKGSQKSGDSHSKSSRRSSKSPDSKRASGRPPAARFPIEGLKSPRKLSRSPAPSSGWERDRDHGTKIEKPRPNDRGEKRERSRSHSRSGSESRRSSHSDGQEEKRRRLSSDSESLPAKMDGGDIAAAMLGDSIDDGQQDVFSEWSDDDEADNILIDGKSRKVRHEVEDLDNHEYDDFIQSPRSKYSPACPRYGDLRDMRMDQDMRISMDTMSEKPIFEKNIPNVKIVEDIQKEKPARENGRRKPDDEGYEEISSDENDLDEEGEKVSKRTIVSILAIDMASLMSSSSKPKPDQGPVLQRYKTANLFAEMGLSRMYAGERLYKEVQDVCQKQMPDIAGPEEKEETKDDIKKDSSEAPCINMSSDAPAATSEVKPNIGLDTSLAPTTIPGIIGFGSPSTVGAVKEDIVGHDKTALTSPKMSPAKRTVDPAKLIRSTSACMSKPTFKLYGDTSAYHKLYKAKAQERSGLLAHFGMFRRALTARKDLDIRRQLCGIDPKHDQSAVYPSGAVDPETYRQCLQLFKQNRPSCVHTDNLAPRVSDIFARGLGKPVC